MLPDSEENKPLLCVAVLPSTVVTVRGEKTKEQGVQLSDESWVIQEQASLPVVPGFEGSFSGWELTRRDILTSRNSL